jgi:hypothetical protein
MTNLPVFEDLSGDIYIQISAPQLLLSQKLFVAAAQLPPARIAELNSAEILQVPFSGATLTIFFLVIASIRGDYVTARFKRIGELEETDSINVLNHIVDILAYP